MKNQENILEEIHNRFTFLKESSSYKSEFDISIYAKFKKKVFNGVFVHTEGFELINTFSGCQNCHQAFQIDTYGQGCIHDCIYCFAKSYGEQKNEWNNPLPLPLDISEIWNTFYTVFETTEPHKFRDILSKKVPLRLGANSDCFMSMDKAYGVTKELLRILSHYNYPYLIVTRSDLISTDEYMSLLRKDLAAVHISIPSLNEELTKSIEPFAPSPKKRLETIRKLVDHGLWVAARVNPLIPCFPDGHYTKGVKGKAPDFFSYELIDEICKNGAQTVLVGMISMTKPVLEKMSLALKFNLGSLMREDKQGERFHYDFKEVEVYYRNIKEICQKNKVEFTTCYLGSGESEYFRFKHLWDNKEDCCNVKNKVTEHKTDSKDIRIKERVDYVGEGLFERVIVNFCLKLMKRIFKGLDEK